MSSKLNDQIHEELAKVNVTIHPYNDIYEDIKKLDASGKMPHRPDEDELCAL